MTENNKYPKGIVTRERISEAFKETEVITSVENEYEEKAVNTAISYMDAFNSSDVNGQIEAINFPHARVGSNGMLRVSEKPADLIPAGFNKWFTEEYGWNHSCWDYRRVVQSFENKVHLIVQFSRYRADGTKIGAFPSFWVITNQDGHWGIKMRSSFAP